VKKSILLLALALFYSLAFSATIDVPPGDGTLSQAITDAQNGDVLRLIPEALYTESANSNFGTITGKTITIEADGDGSAKPVIQLLTPADDNTLMFFQLADQSALVLRGLVFDGTQDGNAAVINFINFTMGDFPSPAAIKKIVVDNCIIHDLKEHVIHAGNSEMASYVLVDSTIVNNVIMKNTGTSVYYKYAGANFISVTNSTFDTINSYGMRIAGPGYSNLPDNTPVVIVDHTTWYNIGTTDGREIILGEKGTFMNNWIVSNSIFVKQVEKTKTVINIKETVSPEIAVINNICLWDVGARVWREHPVSDTLNIDPGFLDPDNGDFTLTAGSQLLTFGSNGKAIGDPRWATNASVVENNACNQAAPAQFALAQNYPNPFNPATKISFTLDKAGMTELVVYDLLGHKVAVPVHQVMSAGEHHIVFDAQNLSTGVYVYRLYFAGRTLSNKMMFIK